MIFDDAKKRYISDPVFHAVVTTMMKFMEDMKLSPGDVREAADFAVMQFWLLHQGPFIVQEDGAKT